MSTFMPLDALRRTAQTPTRPHPPDQQPASDPNSVSGTVGAPLMSFPSIVAVETVSMCNAACTFCPHPVSGKNEHQQSMTADLFTKIVTECAGEPDLRTFNLSFQNEPLMDPHVFERLRQARQTLRDSVTISMVTNGSLLRGRRLQALLADPPDLLKISVTGIDADVYEADMMNLRFHVTLANIENLLALARERGGPKVVINCVMTTAMEKVGVRAIRDFWAERGAQVHVMNLENRAGALPEEQLAGHEGRLNARSWCKRPEQQLSIWPDGAVALCCADWTRQVVLGTTQTQTLREIWHHQTIGRFRDALRNGRGNTVSPCDNCTSAEVTFEGQTYVELGDLAEQL